MYLRRTTHIVRGLWLGLLCVGLAGCGEQGPDEIPITTSSEEARQYYIQGREMTENLRGREAREFYLKALEADEEFALAHYALALNSESTGEFFEHVRQAVSLSYKVSDGERWLILGLEAGTRGQPATQRGYYEKIIEAYPRDERAHTVLGNYHFGQLQYQLAIDRYHDAIELNPEFAPPYNILGYSYRNMGQYEQAEAAFQKYIELIPNEPNPYDSYAEFLMKIGRFDESIEMYRKALAVNPQFTASYIGIGNNQIFQGDLDAARASFKQVDEIATTVGEHRTANFWTAASYVYEGDFERAIEVIRKNYELAGDDLPTRAGDLGLISDLQRQSGKLDQAWESLQEAIKIMERADVPMETKQQARRQALFASARIALERGQLEIAKGRAEEHRQRVFANQVPAEIRQHHWLAGMIALEEGHYEDAVKSLEAAGQANPYVLYQLCQAHEALGAVDDARTYCKRAAEFNGYGLNYAYIRQLALDRLAGL